MRKVWILAKEHRATEPDFTKQTHRSDCFIVGSHEGGSWEFRNPRKPWLEVPADVVPAETGRCRFCGGGR